jgi:hypothetical protein
MSAPSPLTLPRLPSFRTVLDGAKALLFRFTEPNLDLPMAVLRFAVGIILIESYGQFLLDYDLYAGRYALVPWSEFPTVHPDNSLSYFQFVRVLADQKIIAFAAILPMLTFWWGIFPRVSAALSWYFLVSFHDRCPVILDGGDIVLRLVLFFFIFAKSDRRLSPLAPLLPKDPAGSFPIRLIQLQIALVYLCTGLEKLRGAKWQQGNALAIVLRLDSFARADWTRLSSTPAFINVFTYGTLAFEIGFIFLVWQRKSRPWVLISGVAMHLGIEALMYVPMFSWVMMTSYLAFFYNEWAERLVATVLAPLVRRAQKAALTVDVAQPALLEAMRTLDVWQAVTWQAPSGEAKGAPLVAVHRGSAAPVSGAGAYWALAQAVPSFWALAPIASIPGGEKWVASILTRKRAASAIEAAVATTTT